MKTNMNLRITVQEDYYIWILWGRGVSISRNQWYKSKKLALDSAKRVANKFNFTINKVEYTGGA